MGRKVSSAGNKMLKTNLTKLHPVNLFGDDWVDYLIQIKKAKTRDELFGVVCDISAKHRISPGDCVFVFATVLFSEETFQEIVMERDYFCVMRVFDRLQNAAEG